MTIRMIAFDLDGTLFDDHKKISVHTRDALERLAATGMLLVPATGRPFCGLSKEVYRLPSLRYLLTSNGAAVFERGGRCVFENSMKLEKILPLLEELEALSVVVSAFVKGEAFMSEKNKALIPSMLLSEEMKAYIRSSRTCVRSLPEYLRGRGEDVEKLSINFVHAESPDAQPGSGTGGKDLLLDYERAENIVKEYPQFAAVSGGQKDIELTERTANKGTALLALGERLGIGKEEIMAFGDSGNDVEMIRMAGIGVAMGNGEPEAKAAADFITKSNTEDGIVYALRERYGLL